MLRPAIVYRILVIMLLSTGCSGGNGPVVPPDQNPFLNVAVTRLHPEIVMIDKVRVLITRTDEGDLGIPGRDIVADASSGTISAVTDHGDGTYEALWQGGLNLEIIITVSDIDSDPPIVTGITFLSLEYLEDEWDVPVKIGLPISSDGWEAAPFLYPDADRLAFTYITLDIAAQSAGIRRSIGEERPGHSVQETFDIYIADNPFFGTNLLTGWEVQNARLNSFQVVPMHIGAPSVSLDLEAGFCTVQEIFGDFVSASTIYRTDADFEQNPIPIGPPVDMPGFGEDNPYYSATHFKLVFDAFELDDPLSKQDIYSADLLGNWEFLDPVKIQGNLNTENVETQPFVREKTSQLYFASDRDQGEFQLAIYKSSWSGFSASSIEMVASGMTAVGRPSISYEGDWFVFAYAREEPGGVNADIALCPKLVP